MRACITTLLILVSVCALDADQPDDGIYLRAQGKPALWIKSQDGQQLFLGAKQVSKYMKVPLVYRRHPRHNLRVAFTPTKHEFGVGDDVAVTLQITNIGTNRIAFMKGGRNRAARDNQYVFSARHSGKQVDDVGTSHHAGGLASRQVLKPGKVFEDKMSLSKWFAFDKMGIYAIHGSYYLDFNDPHAESWRTIWDDYVSADFVIRIKGPQKASNKPDAGDGQ